MADGAEAVLMSDVIEATASIIDPNAEKIILVERMMQEHLSREQMHTLRDALEAAFLPSQGDSANNDHYIRAFVDAKRVENCSPRTLNYYEVTLRRCMDHINKPVRFVDASDIRRCLSWAMVERKCSPTTVNNERRVLSTFFQWLEDEDVIRKSPVKRTKALKEERADKKPFSDEDIAKMRSVLGNERDKAMFELLLSSGMRVSELCGLDREGVDYQARECEVLGKGRKRRTCYFSAAAKLHMERYATERKDDNPALFVALHRPYNRLKPSAVEVMVREVGKRAGVPNVYPHRFRRTMATNNLRRGMKLEEIQQLLGHSNINTTLIYAKVDKEMLGMNARRLA